MNENLTYSSDGLHLTEYFEGCKLVAYMPRPGDRWTIGYGHTKGVTQGMTCTQAQAEAWLQQDIQEAAAAVRRLVKIKLTQDEFDALADFVFNLGATNFAGSTLLRLLNAGNIAAAAREFEKWDRAGGKEMASLLRRRQTEEKMFLGGQSEFDT